MTEKAFLVKDFLSHSEYIILNDTTQCIFDISKKLINGENNYKIENLNNKTYIYKIENISGYIFNKVHKFLIFSIEEINVKNLNDEKKIVSNTNTNTDENVETGNVFPHVETNLQNNLLMNYSNVIQELKQKQKIKFI
jgi:hypothetical protein